MTNTDAIRTLAAHKPYIHVHGSGLKPRVIVLMRAAGKLSAIRTGGMTVYRLKESK